MKKITPLVSIIMPAHNAECFIEESINSVLFQTYGNFELLIILDNCTDSTEKIVDKYVEQDGRIIKLKTKNNLYAAAGARNLGIKHVRGEFLAFLDSDDVWYQNKLEKQVKFMLDNNLAFTYTDYSVYSENKKRIVKHYKSKDRSTYKKLLSNCTIGCLTVMIDLSQISDVIMPIEALKREDYAAWLRILKRGFVAKRLSQELALYRLVSTSVTNNKFKLIKYHWNVYRNLEKLNFVQSLFHLIIISFHKLFKY